MAYTGPNFVNGGPPAINAANLNGMVNELERLSPIGNETLDIRKGADGTVYSSAGDAVRNQIGNLNSALTQVWEGFYSDVEMTDGYMIQRNTKDPQSNAESSCTNAIPVIAGMRYQLRNVYIAGSRAINWYRANGTLGGTLVYGLADTEVIVTIPNGCATIRATGKYGETVVINSIGDIKRNIDELDDKIDINKAEEDSKINALTSDAYKRSDVNGRNWDLYKFPNGFHMTSPVTVFTDGFRYKTNFKADNFKNSGGNTIYACTNPSLSADGTREKPYSFNDAYTHASSGDTIVMLEGLYDRTYAYNTIKKSINVIGEGDVRIFVGNFPDFTAMEGYNHVYSGQRTQGVFVYDLVSLPNEYVQYKAVNSVEEVEAEAGTFYRDTSNYTFYVHPLFSGNPTSKLGVSVTAENPFSVSNENASVKVYIGNITVIGARNGIKIDKASSSNSLDACYDHVKFIYCGTTAKNAFTVYGGNVVLNKCECDGSFRDGFNYNGTNDAGSTYRDCFITEIDCKSHNAGINQSEQSMNGSTAHKNAKVIRINGLYYDNFGANCADVQDDTESVNLGCIAYNSTATGGYKQNFSIQQSGATMWCENCVGIDGITDFYNVSGGTMNTNKCTYTTKSESVTDTNPITYNDYILRDKLSC